MGFHSVAIDGPSGAGKSTLAKRVAAEIGYIYVDTGAIYRTLGVFAHKMGVSPEDEAGVTALLRQAEIGLAYAPDGLQHMFLNGEDVTDEIRKPEISQLASAVSAIAAVRDFLLHMQRELAETHNVIMDGRDIGSVVLPQADLKIYLTADAEDRARRRQIDLAQRGHNEEFGKVLSDILSRDVRDSSRATAPLCQAQDAVLVDTTGETEDESYQLLLAAIRGKLKL